MNNNDFRIATFVFMIITLFVGAMLVIRYNHERVIIGENGECKIIKIEEPEDKDKTTQWMLASERICGDNNVKSFNIEQVNGYSQPKVECVGGEVKTQE